LGEYKQRCVNRRQNIIEESRQSAGAKPPATANKQLGRQIRKILGKHYANKYRVR
jgi:hypothetical protein